ncbi:hypothetical protein [Paractinoplanes rishiriensis]|uniref:Uncharacterized protein n=1 Tax=Paractinoplanes rishiriensis TaxID=1050105 RepID=A0A919JW13_9ACTN|nr:hypothetical protein [Actinoplanes rishiriensis]GIE94309.1 hypothetical protein Ari01nite_17740 [Actinoplanes rishiriensis]
MDQIPAPVETAVRTAAQAAPGYRGDLDSVYRRARARRQRLIATAAGVAVLITAAGVGLAQRRPAPPVTVLPATQPVVKPAPAQRLLLSGAVGTYRTDGAAVRLGGRDRVGEILPDGTLAGHPVQGADGWDRTVGLPDGRLVALGPRDLMPDVERPDGPDIEGLEYNLVVAAPDGAVQLSRDVRVKGEAVTLLTATAETAWLWRPAGLYSHDLATGTESLAVPRKTLGIAQVFDGSTQFADLNGDRLIVAADSTRCAPKVLDIGQPVRPLPLALADCSTIANLRLSPDGNVVAVTYLTRQLIPHVALVRIADGRVLADQAPSIASSSLGWGMDVVWPDNRSVTVVTYPVEPSGTYRLKPTTITTGS